MLKNFDSINIPKNFITIKHQSLYFLSYSYLKEKSFDSAYFYANKYFALEKDLGIKKAEFNYKELLAEIEYYKTNYKKTIKLLDEISVDDFYTTSFNYTFLYGSSLNKLNKKEEAFHYFKLADSIYNSTNDLMPEIRMVQEFFIDYYKEKKEIKNQLKYINKLLYVDSIIDFNSKTLNETITKKYDTPILIAEKEKIIYELNNHHKNYNLIIIILSSLTLISSILIVRNKRKQKKLNKRIKSLENNSSKNKKLATKFNSGIEGVPQNVIDSILNNLNSFEKNHLFLNNEIKLNSLAKSLNTNANYLSKVINHFKEKNFNTYLTDLRIDYCINKLKAEKIYRKFTIQAIAYEAGFNNTESFSKAFHKKTGVYPSNFIKKLNKKLEI
ncbi:AraC family transcriptional regulator [uncultured Lutibacter sp.]|uniref:helix-turn-helix domain-containing protein n=1 Tax=uncultured Lutibacter sp. TaxID=437739 RepID=UPI00261DBC04|nr:helix-turn-helix domain-containing protein [uncultured Lutibacter sp.]